MARIMHIVHIVQIIHFIPVFQTIIFLANHHIIPVPDALVCIWPDDM